MTREELIAAVHKGAHKANRLYCEWSGGDWITDYGVEGLMVCEIARTIQGIRSSGYLTMEESFQAMKDWSGNSTLGRKPKCLDGSKRVDIALWNSKELVTHVIEVKRHWNQACYGDLDRICALQSKLESVQCGLFVLFVVVKGEADKLNEALEDHEDTFREYLAQESFRLHRGIDYSCRNYTDGTYIGNTICVEVFGRH